jgi:hypothetical protein
MTKLRILGAVALSSFISAAALADQPNSVTFPAQPQSGSVFCQVASADGATGATEPGMCTLPGTPAHVIAMRPLK